MRCAPCTRSSPSSGRCSPRLPAASCTAAPHPGDARRSTTCSSPSWTDLTPQQRRRFVAVAHLLTSSRSVLLLKDYDDLDADDAAAAVRWALGAPRRRRARPGVEGGPVIEWTAPGGGTVAAGDDARPRSTAPGLPGPGDPRLRRRLRRAGPAVRAADRSRRGALRERPLLRPDGPRRRTRAEGGQGEQDAAGRRPLAARPTPPRAAATGEGRGTHPHREAVDRGLPPVGDRAATSAARRQPGPAGRRPRRARRRRAASTTSAGPPTTSSAA